MNSFNDIQFIQVITTTDCLENAETIARELVDNHLAACVQIVGPLSSVYRWKGKIETAKEWQCVIKSKVECYPKIEASIKKIHAYELPEIIAIPVVAGSREYLNWITTSVK